MRPTPLLLSTGFPGVAALSETLPKTHQYQRKARIPILQYHDDWVCIDKPCGLTVHRSENTPRTSPVLNTTLKRQLQRKVFPVHRLDHRTSGAMLFAFDSETANRLHTHAIRKGRKQYIAQLRGDWKHDSHEIVVDKPLKVKNDVIKEAQTKFTLLASTTTGEDNRCSLVLCEPLTGRTHQIRRHAWEISHPVIGDTEHGDSRVNRWWREEWGLDRLALHCWTLDFVLEAQEDDDSDHEEEGKRQPQHHSCIAPLSLSWQYALKGAIPDLWEEATTKQPRLLMEPQDLVGGTHGRHYRRKQSEKED